MKDSCSSSTGSDLIFSFCLRFLGDGVLCPKSSSVLIQNNIHSTDKENLQYWSACHSVKKNKQCSKNVQKSKDQVSFLIEFSGGQRFIAKPMIL